MVGHIFSKLDWRVVILLGFHDANCLCERVATNDFVQNWKIMSRCETPRIAFLIFSCDAKEDNASHQVEDEIFGFCTRLTEIPRVVSEGCQRVSVTWSAIASAKLVLGVLKASKLVVELHVVWQSEKIC